MQQPSECKVMRSRARLSSQMVMDIFAMKFSAHPDTGKRLTATSLSKVYGVSEKAIRDIWIGRTWHKETAALERGIPRTSLKTKSPNRFKVTSLCPDRSSGATLTEFSEDRRYSMRPGDKSQETSSDTTSIWPMPFDAANMRHTPEFPTVCHQIGSGDTSPCPLSGARWMSGEQKAAAVTLPPFSLLLASLCIPAQTPPAYIDLSRCSCSASKRTMPWPPDFRNVLNHE